MLLTRRLLLPGPVILAQLATEHGSQLVQQHCLM